MRSQEDDLTAVSQRGADQFVALVNSDGDDAARHHIAEIFQRCLFHGAVASGEENVSSFFFQIAHGEHVAHGFAGLQRNQIGNVLALAGCADIGNFIDLQPVHASGVGEDENVGVG